MCNPSTQSQYEEKGTESLQEVWHSGFGQQQAWTTPTVRSSCFAGGEALCSAKSQGLGSARTFGAEHGPGLVHQLSSSNQIPAEGFQWCPPFWSQPAALAGSYRWQTGPCLGPSDEEQGCSGDLVSIYGGPSMPAFINFTVYIYNIINYKFVFIYMQGIENNDIYIYRCILYLYI